MNIIKDLIRRIEERRQDNKDACKNYATEEAAEKATAKMAMDAAIYFTKGSDIEGVTVTSAEYVVFYVPSWGRWVGAINLSELLKRGSSTGGYLGFCKDFYTW